MLFKELETVVLTEDIPTQDLRRGDIGAIVHTYQNPEGYEVEFVTLGGETIAVMTLLPSQIRHADKRELPHVRAVA